MRVFAALRERLLCTLLRQAYPMTRQRILIVYFCGIGSVSGPSAISVPGGLIIPVSWPGNKTGRVGRSRR